MKKEAMKRFWAIMFGMVLTIVACESSDALNRDVETTMLGAVEGIEVDIADIKRETASLLADEAKAKYAKLGYLIDTIEIFFSSAKSEIRTTRKTALAGGLTNHHFMNAIITIDGKLIESMQQALQAYINILNFEGERYGLRPHEIKKIIEKNELELDSLTNQLSQIDKKRSKSELYLILAKLELDIVNYQLMIVREISQLVGGPPISCYFGFYPLVLPKQNCIKKGDSFEASIGLVPYQLPFPPSDVILTVDGKQLHFEKGWYSSFKTEPIMEAKKVIKISCKLRDELTGKMMEAFTDFPYEIKVE